MDRHSADPFAVDLFDARSTVTPRKERFKKQEKDQDTTETWHSGLATVSETQLRTPVPMSKGPWWLEDCVNGSVLGRLSELFAIRPEQADFKVVSIEETDLDGQIEVLDTPGNVLSGFARASDYCVIAVSTAFVSELIDRLLRGSGSLGPTPELTTMETAIGEFLMVEALSKFNAEVDRQNTVEIRSFMQGGTGGVNTEGLGLGLEVVGDLVVGNHSAMVTFLLPHTFVTDLNSFYATNQPRHTVSDVSGLEHFVEGLTFRLIAGKSVLSTGELKSLEKDDVVLIETENEALYSEAAGSKRLTLEIGRSIVLDVEMTSSREEEVSCRVMEISVNSVLPDMRVTIDKSVEEKKVMADENFSGFGLEPLGEPRNDADEKVGPVALEDVVVDLKVRLAGRKISLAELGELRAGQVIELGCRPDDPVELIADNSGRPIASGELVKVEERLGVRITRVFV